jgi:uncharacterized protein (TIGR02597 family)
VPDQQTAGVNLAPSQVFYYYTGTSGDGWRGTSTGPDVIVNDTVIYPDSSFIVRNKQAQGSTLTFMGTVHMGTMKTPLGTIANNTKQDNAVALAIPAPLTLSDTKLFESGAFVGSTSHNLLGRGDELLVWDNAVLGLNKSATTIYYYYSGTTDPVGWRKSGDSATIVNTDVVYNSGKVFTVRKKATAAPATVNWALKPSYVAAETP